MRDRICSVVMFCLQTSSNENLVEPEDTIYQSTGSIYRITQFELWYLGMIQDVNLGGVHDREPDILLIDKVEEAQVMTVLAFQGLSLFRDACLSFSYWHSEFRIDTCANCKSVYVHIFVFFLKQNIYLSLLRIVDKIPSASCMIL